MASNIIPEFCFVLGGQGNGKAIALKSLNRYKEKGVWVHLDEENEDTPSWLLKNIKDETIIENLLDEDTQPRYFSTPSGLFVVLRGVNLNKNADVDDMVSLRFWIEKNRIVSISQQGLPAIEMTVNSLLHGVGAFTPLGIFIEIAGEINERISQVVSKIDDELDDIEDAVIDADRVSSNSVRAKISQARHKILGMRRYVGPQRDLFVALKSLSVEGLQEDDKEIIKQMSRDLSKAVEDLDYAREHSTVSQEELDSRISVQISQTMYILSIITIIFAPLTLITGILGANIGGIPWNEEPMGFWNVTFLLLGMAFLMVLILKWRRWF